MSDWLLNNLKSNKVKISFKNELVDGYDILVNHDHKIILEEKKSNTQVKSKLDLLRLKQDHFKKKGYKTYSIVTNDNDKLKLLCDHLKTLVRPKKKKNTRRKELQEFANNLNENMPKSEIWFNNVLKSRKLTIKFEQNQVFNKYIPDYISKDYKIIIEVDGKIHLRSDIRAKDKEKDKYYSSQGYKVFRVIAFDEISANRAIDRIFSIVSRIRNKKKINKHYEIKHKPKNQARLKMYCQVCNCRYGKHIEHKNNGYIVCSHCEVKLI